MRCLVGLRIGLATVWAGMGAGVPMARAETTIVDGVTWTYSVKGGEASVTKAKPAKGELLIPPELDGYSVTSIGDSAFSRCSELASVIIPDGVTNIGNSAFFRCTELKNVNIPCGVTRI